MCSDPVLKNIIIYPVKALDGIQVDEAAITSKGALQFDRRFALTDADGKFINGKKYPAVHLLHAEYNLDEMYIMLSVKNNSEQYFFSLTEQQSEIAKWFSNYFSKEVKFVENDLSGFPDDTDAYGPTVVSLASIKEAATWFNFEIEETIKRFRPNLIIDNVPPFWEDSLYGEVGENNHFKIGAVTLLGVNPCNRCSVPARNPENADVFPDFQKIFMEMREKTLPDFAVKNRFNHFYKFCLNTETPLTEAGKKIHIGDKVYNHL